MSRPLRIVYDGAWYHVMNRGAASRLIFTAESHRNEFLGLLSDINQLFNVQTHAYCLMDNHYHLILHTPNGFLSKAMSYLNGVYTRRFNRYQQIDGPLFRGRYKAILIEADEYLLAVSRYIHLNPVKAKMVDLPENYKWSSYRAYIGIETPEEWLQTQFILNQIGNDQQHLHYFRFMQHGVDEELAKFYENNAHPLILGRQIFKEDKLRCIKQSNLEEFEPHVKRLRHFPSLEEIMNVICNHFNIDQKNLNEHHRGIGNLPRAITMYIARKYGAHSLAAISNAVNNIKPQAVSVSIKRSEVKFKNDHEFRKIIKRILKKIV